MVGVFPNHRTYRNKENPKYEIIVKIIPIEEKMKTRRAVYGKL